jgi:predicted signal transduction protein with EAL and GGDEF domain
MEDPRPKTPTETVIASAKCACDESEELLIRADKAIQHAKELAKTYEGFLNRKSKPNANR